MSENKPTPRARVNDSTDGLLPAVQMQREVEKNALAAATTKVVNTWNTLQGREPVFMELCLPQELRAALVQLAEAYTTPVAVRALDEIVKEAK